MHKKGKEKELPIDATKENEDHKLLRKIVEEEMNKGASLEEMQERNILKDWSSWGKHIT